MYSASYVLDLEEYLHLFSLTSSESSKNQSPPLSDLDGHLLVGYQLKVLIYCYCFL